mmetsp:Transcript_31244/g.81056  ORF Transcript_31244/g.81056 Transcript_31244/m.81056 type:complete len:211 (+) Transcript_31244:524-1156(+)
MFPVRTSWRAAVLPGHAAAVVQTAGTTQDPKDVLLSHDGLVAAAAAWAQVVHQSHIGSVRHLAYMPLGHVHAVVLDLVMPMILASAHTVHVVFTQNSLGRQDMLSSLRRVQPTWLCGSPGLWSTVASAVEREAQRQQQCVLGERPGAPKLSIGNTTSAGTWRRPGSTSAPWLWSAARGMQRSAWSCAAGGCSSWRRTAWRRWAVLGVLDA